MLAVAAWIAKQERQRVLQLHRETQAGIPAAPAVEPREVA